MLLKNGALAGSMGQMLGVGPGRGIGLVFMGMGLIKIGAVLAAYLRPEIRHIEDQMPDALQSRPE